MAYDKGGWLTGLGLLLLGGVAVGAYVAVKGAGSGSTVAGETASTTLPDTFVNLTEVQNRFDEVVELYRMNYLAPVDAKSQTGVLIAYAKALKAENEIVAAELVDKMNAFIAEVEEFENTITAGSSAA